MSQARLRSSLQIPDALSWRDAAGYSPEAAEALRYAYEALRQTRVDSQAYRTAYAAVIPYRSRRVSLAQRMHIAYVLAQAYASEENYANATASTDLALDVAALLADRAAQVELHYLRGSVTDAQTELGTASDHYFASLQNLRTLADSTDWSSGPLDHDFELTLLIRLAAMNFELAQFDRSLLYLADAYDLWAKGKPQASQQGAYIGWLYAQLLRWQGDLSEAFTTALTASEMLGVDEVPGAAGRLQTLVAEIALDLAESFSSVKPISAARTAVLSLARPYAKRAVQFTRMAEDIIGAEIAQLALLRFDRLSNHTTGRSAKLEAMARKARRLEDIALYGRVQTELGDEFAARGEYSSARQCYTLAWRLLEEHDLRAMAQRARRRMFKVGDAI